MVTPPLKLSSDKKRIIKQHSMDIVDDNCKSTVLDAGVNYETKEELIKNFGWRSSTKSFNSRSR